MSETEFRSALRLARLSASLSQRELADAAGISERAISDLECGRRRRPYPATVRRLALALGLEGEAFRQFSLLSRSVAHQAEEPAETTKYADDAAFQKASFHEPT